MLYGRLTCPFAIGAHRRWRCETLLDQRLLEPLGEPYSSRGDKEAPYPPKQLLQIDCVSSFQAESGSRYIVRDLYSLNT